MRFIRQAHLKIMSDYIANDQFLINDAIERRQQPQRRYSTAQSTKKPSFTCCTPPSSVFSTVSSIDVKRNLVSLLYAVLPTRSCSQTVAPLLFSMQRDRFRITLPLSMPNCALPGRHLVHCASPHPSLVVRVSQAHELKQELYLPLYFFSR